MTNVTRDRRIPHDWFDAATPAGVSWGEGFHCETAQMFRTMRSKKIGMNSIILKGVAIGDNSVVGAGAVVSRSVPPNTVVARNPARIVRRLSAGATGASRKSAR